ncbi:MAG TPA: protoheme IX farnesyltransferase [Actinobacteria bacterium]|nr:protoheme IX farnesyltransferase [Actinomycetota bacterium]
MAGADPAAPVQGRPAPAVRRVLSAYVRLTKPRIIELLLVTTVPAMVLADRGIPSLWLMLATLAGGTLAAGGANAINQYLDRDIDQIMSRTRGRPLPAHAIEPRRALAFGIALGLVSFGFLTLTVNLLSAVLSLAALAFYVFVYTMWLKRRSTQNIVIGGAAGCVPVLVGWAAVTGGVDLTALSLFLLIFFWTPPHFWALAQIIRRDYENAHVPMLPVVAGNAATKRQSLAYAVLTLGVSVVPFFTHAAGAVYLAGAVALGVGLVAACALDLAASGWTSRVFRYSLVYMAGVFLLLAIGSFQL